MVWCCHEGCAFSTGSITVLPEHRVPLVVNAIRRISLLLFGFLSILFVLFAEGTLDTWIISLQESMDKHLEVQNHGSTQALSILHPLSFALPFSSHSQSPQEEASGPWAFPFVWPGCHVL